MLSRRTSYRFAVAVLTTALIAAPAPGADTNRFVVTPPGLPPGVETGWVFTDIDRDGDLDGFADSKFFENVGTPARPSFATDTLLPFEMDGQGGDVSEFADIDGDGDLDVFSLWTDGTILFNERRGHPCFPSFAPAVHNPFGLGPLSQGRGSTVWLRFGDLDGDGDLDAMTAIAGFFFYYENIGSEHSPRFEAGRFSPFGLSAFQHAEPRLQLVDLDRDGDLDVYADSGKSSPMYGDPRAPQYFENVGGATSPRFAAVVSSPFGLSQETVFADLDGDGDRDGISRSGNYFENTGGRGPPQFAQPFSNRFGLRGNSFTDIDGDGDVDAFLGVADGLALWQENFGTATAPAFLPPAVNPFGLGGTRLSFADVDGDGDPDALGDSGFSFFENIGSADSPAFASPGPPPFGLSDRPSLRIRRDFYVDSIGPTMADWDGDGDLDAFYTANFTMSVLMRQNIGGVTDPMFAAPRSIHVEGNVDLRNVDATEPLLIDFDGDTDLDIVRPTNLGEVEYLENIGSVDEPAFRSTELASLRNMGDHTTVRFLDVDGDGDLDAFAGNDSGQVRFYESRPPPSLPLQCPPQPVECTEGFDRARLVAKSRGHIGRTVVAKLSSGPALGIPVLGNPTKPDGTSYALCLYDETATLVASFVADRAGDTCAEAPLWRKIGDRGFLYKDTTGKADGIRRLLLRANSAGHVSLAVRISDTSGRGFSVPVDTAAALEGSTSATVQIHAGPDTCFSSELLDVRSAETERFHASQDGDPPL